MSLELLLFHFLSVVLVFVLARGFSAYSAAHAVPPASIPPPAATQRLSIDSRAPPARLQPMSTPTPSGRLFIDRPALSKSFITRRTAYEDDPPACKSRVYNRQPSDDQILVVSLPPQGVPVPKEPAPRPTSARVYGHTRTNWLTKRVRKVCERALTKTGPKDRGAAAWPPLARASGTKNASRACASTSATMPIPQPNRSATFKKWLMGFVGKYRERDTEWNTAANNAPLSKFRNLFLAKCSQVNYN
jgi:hypothetical protein